METQRFVVSSFVSLLVFVTLEITGLQNFCARRRVAGGMTPVLNPYQGFFSLSSPRFSYKSPKLLPFKSVQRDVELTSTHGAHSSSKGTWELVNPVKCSLEKVYGDSSVESEFLPLVQTLIRFPKEELVGKVVMVRFDSFVLLSEEVDQSSDSILTINYLRGAGAKVILGSEWSKKMNSEVLDVESVAAILSQLLNCKVETSRCISCGMQLRKEDIRRSDVLLLENLARFKGEFSNSAKFAELLSVGIDIFVNDSFSQSHKILASTVGITRYCYASMAGLYFEKCICQLRQAGTTSKRPYTAIIGGGNLPKKAAALHFLASRCDVFIFVGLMAYQIMHALGWSVPLNLVQHEACKAAKDIVKYLGSKNTQIVCPKDVWGATSFLPAEIEIFPSDEVWDGWVPVDLGPSSLNEMQSLITKSKKIIWMGPVNFVSSNQQTKGATELAKMLCRRSQSECEITVVGNTACDAVTNEMTSLCFISMLRNASVVWEFLKGRKLPAVMSLDRAYPFDINWKAVYRDPTQALVVDIGSGNGRFIFGMTTKRKDLNFLGLENNAKLVKRCIELVDQSGIDNGYFIETNATSTFRFIISTYPGKLDLVSIQCPNPDFNDPDNRWRMLQRSLIEAIADLLSNNGKVFLQSDIESVAVRMKEEFLKHGKDKLHVMNDHLDDASFGAGVWMKENPFGVRSDWEQHVLDRGCQMYRLMLTQSS